MKRYSPGRYVLLESNSGIAVLYSDYEAEIARLKSENDYNTEIIIVGGRKIEQIEIEVKRLQEENDNLVTILVDTELITKSRAKELTGKPIQHWLDVMVKSPVYEAGRIAAAKECYQIASSHEFGPDAAKCIRETFGLEI